MVAMAFTLAFRRAALLLLLLLPSPALADAVLQSEAEDAVMSFVAAVAAGDEEGLSAVLAPEFQILRPTGVGYDRDGYLAQGAPSVRIEGGPVIDDLIATREGDVMVVRYMLTVVETIDGQAVQARAPRLSVFRRAGERWLIVAHANFAGVAQ
jgi:ketosteroid isomerase-like protein